MTKITVDLSAIRNDITQLKEEAFQGLTATSDLERQKILKLVIEKLKTLQTRLASNSASVCLLYTSPSPRDRQKSRMPSSA